MKLAIKSDNVGWVLDSIKEDYKIYSNLEIIEENRKPDLTWCLNFWALSNCNFANNVVAQIHHINTDKINEYNFDILKKTKSCIVCNKKMLEYVSRIYDGPVLHLPYWLLSSAMKPIRNNTLKELLSKDSEILIGSFQKDGEGKTGGPKMIKGPDIFIDIVKILNKRHNIKVILSGFCRDWVISQLKQNGIKYEYFPMYGNMGELYNCLDWYFVTSRNEGGPQAVLEAPYRMVKILSKNVGIADEVLHPNCLCNTVDDFVAKFETKYDYIDYNFAKSEARTPEKIIPMWDNFFLSQVNK